MQNKNLYVSVPSLAPMREFTEILQKAWDSKILTHDGPLLQQLEKEINELLGVEDSITMTNGTVALQLAIRALGLSGEIITTPFTWIATTSAITYEGCKPIYVDIDPETLNMNPDLLEDAITEKTVAIMPVHVFSNPCQIEKIEEIAKKHNLKVIYDAAHAFDVQYKGQSIMKYGDISCASYHATKLFNTGEGGACFSTDKALVEKLRELRFFGHDKNKEIVGEGCNGKMTEIHAALGIANLKYHNEVLKRRQEIYDLYFEGLSSCINIKFQKIDKESYNYSYMPIILDSEELTIELIKKLNKKNIFPRRYFYPSLDTVEQLNKNRKVCSNSQDISKRIICLPSNNLITDREIKDTITTIRTI